MTSIENICFIKYWLQKFGKRDNEVFYQSIKIEDVKYEISLQYSFCEEGYELIPYNWCSTSFRDNSSLEDMSDEILEKIVKKLKEIKEFY